MGYAFISYSGEQTKDAVTLRDILNANGIRTWLAIDDIPPGHEYPEEIVRAIKDCACCILLLTKDSMDSKHVKNEMALVTSNKKPLFPIKLDDVVLDFNFQYHLSTSQIIKVETISLNSKEIRKLLAAVSVYTNADPEPAAPPQETVNPTPVWPLGGFRDGAYQSPWTGTFQANETQGQAQPVFPPSGTGFPYTASFNTFSQAPYVNTAPAAVPQTQSVPDTSYHGLPGFLKKKKDPVAPVSTIREGSDAFHDPAVLAEINSLVENIAREEFSVEKNGYSMDQVDEMLDGLCDRLDSPDLNQRSLAECNFYPDSIKLKKAARGYSVTEVDAFLQKIKLSIVRILAR